MLITEKKSKYSRGAWRPSLCRHVKNERNFIAHEAHFGSFLCTLENLNYNICTIKRLFVGFKVINCNGSRL